MTLGLPVSTMLAFLLVLARVAGLVTFLPVPGFRAVPAIDPRGSGAGDHIRAVSGVAVAPGRTAVLWRS